MKPLSGRMLLLLFAVYAVACVLLGLFVHRAFYTGLVALFFAQPVLREFGIVADRDEWQVAVSHRSSHVAFLVAMGIAAGAFVKTGIIDNREPPFIATLVLFVSLLVKVATWQLTSRGRRRTGLVLGFVIGGLWLLFTALEGNLSPEFLVGGIPLLAAILALKWQRLGGALLLVCGAVTGYFFILTGGSPERSRLFVALMLPAPLILAGVLLMMRRDDVDRAAEPDRLDRKTGSAAAASEERGEEA
jgi:hypothetical protein